MYLASTTTTRRNGFTFIEVMIVIVIIGILAGAVTLSTRHYLDKAKVNRAKSDLSTYRSALESYYGEHGRYPSAEEGLRVLSPQFIDKTRTDPWNRPYVYRRPGASTPYEIACLGADGREGGDGVDSDINSADHDTTEKTQ